MTNEINNFITKLSEHIYLAGSAMLFAILIGIPLGIVIYHTPKLRKAVLAVINIFQTIPSIALLAILIPLLGIGAAPTIVALCVYALLPITRSTFVALSELPSDSLEAAKALGFSQGQTLLYVELPLAAPIVMSGIRMATAITIGITTIAAFIGAGGLGDFISQGLALDSNRLILLGAIPAALLALLLDFILSYVERRLLYYKEVALPRWQCVCAWVFGLILVVIVATNFAFAHNSSDKNTIVIGSKNFTEQFILADLLADLLRHDTKLHVITKLNLGATAIVQDALLKGDVDLYPEYTGTGYMSVLHYKKLLNAKQTYALVKQQYAKRFKLTWLKPLGFNNSQTLAVTDAFAAKHHLKSLSDLALISQSLSIAAPAEFIKRADALPGLTRVYHLKFKQVLQMEPDLMYRAIKAGDVQVIEVFTTDGRIAAYHLTTLKDNKHFYPPYDAAIVIRQATLKRYPFVKKVLNKLAGKISQSDMQHMNYAVNVQHQSAALVAQRFLQKLHLL